MTSSISVYQSGFRRNHRTETRKSALSDLYSAMDDVYPMILES